MPLTMLYSVYFVFNLKLLQFLFITILKIQQKAYVQARNDRHLAKDIFMNEFVVHSQSSN